MIKIRCKRFGRKKKPFYRILVMNTKYFHTGYFIEQIGFYDPINKNIKKINIDRLKYWKNVGAQVTTRVKNILKNISA
jgi:small subunit ribosomal protein S16